MARNVQVAGVGGSTGETSVPLGVRVEHAMLRRPKTLPAEVSVAEAAAAFSGGHVHMLLLTDGPTLVGTLVESDLPTDATSSATGPARPLSVLDGRTVAPDAVVVDVEDHMVERGLRRLAVVDERNVLLGLMCLKRRGEGFCSDADVASRSVGPGRRPGGAGP